MNAVPPIQTPAFAKLASPANVDLQNRAKKVRSFNGEIGG
jgi:hypothetical protein